MLKVIINKANRDEIRKRFGVSPGTISNAFNYRRFTEQHSEIRSYAVNFLKATVVEV